MHFQILDAQGVEKEGKEEEEKEKFLAEEV